VRRVRAAVARDGGAGVTGPVDAARDRVEGELRIAVIRGIPDSYAHATARTPPLEPIDVARARVQHRAYANALLDLGLAVFELPAAHDLPDSCFVEDCALVAGGVALAPVLGAPSRRSESHGVTRALDLSLDHPLSERYRWGPTCRSRPRRRT
jgi:hypothetical protein